MTQKLVEAVLNISKSVCFFLPVQEVTSLVQHWEMVKTDDD